eukprot:gene10493-14091_t
MRTEGASKMFGGFRALNKITAEFSSGAITSIIGPNGAGKSTYFNLLSGALRPSNSTLPLITNVFPQLTTRENVRVGLQAFVSRYNMWSPRAKLPGLVEKADDLLSLVGLWERRERPARELAH